MNVISYVHVISVRQIMDGFVAVLSITGGIFYQNCPKLSFPAILMEIATYQTMHS